MKPYGQFCPMALAAEIVAERWTLLVIREIAFGSTRYNDIQRGVPRMSSALLSRRLRTLEQAGMIDRTSTGGYELSKAGAALIPVIDALAVWGKTWLPATLSDLRWDPDLVMWDMHRRMNLELLPEEQTTVQFTFTDQPKAKRNRWIICDRSGAELCTVEPANEVNLYVTTDSRTITGVWYGDLSLTSAMKTKTFQIDGPPRLCTAFPSWIKLSRMADVPRRTHMIAAR